MIIRLSAESWSDARQLSGAEPWLEDSYRELTVLGRWMRAHYDVGWTVGARDEQICAWCACPINDEYSYRNDSSSVWVCLNCAVDAAVAAQVITVIPRMWIESE